MKTLCVVFLAGLFLVSGSLNAFKQIRATKTLEEIVGFINLVKTEVHYKTADFDELFMKGKAQNYKYISFLDEKIFLDKPSDKKYSTYFNGFISKIGTTDEDGQINMCEEYKERFQELLTKRKIKEKEKLQVNTALSVFGALTVLIFFL